jgi:hypothetical protein
MASLTGKEAIQQLFMELREPFEDAASIYEKAASDPTYVILSSEMQEIETRVKSNATLTKKEMTETATELRILIVDRKLAHEKARRQFYALQASELAELRKLVAAKDRLSAEAADAEKAPDKQLQDIPDRQDSELIKLQKLLASVEAARLSAEAEAAKLRSSMESVKASALIKANTLLECRGTAAMSVSFNNDADTSSKQKILIELAALSKTGDPAAMRVPAENLLKSIVEQRSDQQPLVDALYEAASIGVGGDIGALGAARFHTALSRGLIAVSVSRDTPGSFQRAGIVGSGTANQAPTSASDDSLNAKDRPLHSDAEIDELKEQIMPLIYSGTAIGLRNGCPQ